MDKSIRQEIDALSFDEFSKLNYANLNYQKYIWYSPLTRSFPITCQFGMKSERKGKCYCFHHCYPYLALEFLLEGSLNYEFDGNAYQAHSGELILLQHRRDSKFHNPPEAHYKKQVLIISGTQVGSLVESLGLSDCWQLNIADQGEIIQRFQEIFDLLEQQSLGTEWLISEKTYSLLVWIARLENQRRHVSIPKQLDRALSFLNRSYMNKLNLAELATASGMSKSTLERLFHRYLNCSPLEYLVKVRLDMAASLLRTSNLSIKEVACHVGYNNQLYFSTAFKKYKGVTPREFRC